MSARNHSAYTKAPNKLSRRRSGVDGQEILGSGSFVAGTEDDRAARLQQKQHQLETVLDNHDTLVREYFHLEKFVTLLHYDPKAAKEDTSAVFQEYKASNFDLLEQSVEAGPSRRTTRKAHTERVQHLKGSATGPSAAPEGKQRKKTEMPKQSNNITPSTLSKLKGKGRHVTVDGGEPGRLIPEHNRKGKGREASFDDFTFGQSTLHISDVAQSAGTRCHKRVAEDASPAHANGQSHIPPGKKRKTGCCISSNIAVGSHFPVDSMRQSGGSENFEPPSVPPSESTFAAYSTRSSRHARRLQVTGRSLLMSNHPPSMTPSRLLSPVKPSLPRIKLIVRRPPPSISNPRQRLPTPRHEGSLTAVLSSYYRLSDDDGDIDVESLEQMARKEAAIWDRADFLQRQGRFFFPIDNTATSAPSTPPRDSWAHVVEAVVARSSSRPVDGVQVASQVASKIRTYWEGQAVKEDKVKLQEEKRLRALAKATIHMVVAEWKKAVHYVREKERERIEDEEKKLGDQHLSALVDQSGSILKAQHLDLSKAVSRSRSSSVSGAFGRWNSPSLEPYTEVVGEDDDDAQDELDSDEDDEDLDSRALLGDDLPIPVSSRRSVTSSQTSSPPPTLERDDPDTRSDSAVSSQDLLGTVRTTSPSSPLGHLDSYGNLKVTESHTEDVSERSMSIILSSYRKSPSTPLFPDITSFHIVNEPDYTTSPDDLLDRHSHETHSRFKSPTPLDSFSAYKTPPTKRQYSNQDDYERFLSSPDVESTPIHLDEASRSSTVQPEEQLEHHHKASESPAHDTIHLDITPEPSTDADDERLVLFTEVDTEEDASIPVYLRPFAVAPIVWDPQWKIKAPLLLRGTLRPYQQAGLEWLASLHTNNLNGILADEMGLGKTIQTISLLAHLACDRGIWGPHLIIVPTSVLLNWEMEFKKFLPGFKILSYHGNSKRRKELRQGWNDKYHFNVCVTSYTLASRDAHVFKRKHWYYMILDEAHMIKNFKSQRWNTLLMFRSFRRLLLTGTPLQNNLTELWALLQFLMSGTNFANLKEFGEWFSNPLEKAIEMGNVNEETQQRVSKLHTVLRPYLLRRLKRDVEKELPSKFEHLVTCPLSKRQRFLYDEFMARANTRHDLQSGIYQKIANILMQLRKVVNHPDLFEVRPIVTSFAMEKSAIADFEIKELLIRREMLKTSDEDVVNLDVLGLQFVARQNTSILATRETRRLDGTWHLPMITELPGEPPPHDTRTSQGYKRYRAYQQRAASIARWSHIGYLNRLRCNRLPIYSKELLRRVETLYEPLRPLAVTTAPYLNTVDRIHAAIKSYSTRADEMAGIIDRFAFATPAVVARDLPAISLSGFEEPVLRTLQNPLFDSILHRASVKLQIAFPDPSLLQYDCGKLQELARLLRERKAGGHRVLIFTQMTRILDILEIFLNLHGYLYLRLDGATKIEDRQYITERFNSDQRVFCFIASSRSGGVGINLTGADTVIFYDSDFNPQMDKQCEDRAHRIGQIRDVHIYRFISRHTVEEALLRKANQKRSLDDLVIQKGEFDWRSLFSDEVALTKALGEFEDSEDAHAAAVAAREEFALEGADKADFADGGNANARRASEDIMEDGEIGETQQTVVLDHENEDEEDVKPAEDKERNIEDYMIDFVRSDMEYFRDL